MADFFARVTYPSVSPSVEDFSVPFPYLDQSHVQVLVLEAGEEEAVVAPTSEYEWTSTSLIHRLTDRWDGATVTIQRVTPNDTPLARFSGGTLSSRALNTGNVQLLYLTQEAADAGLASALALGQSVRVLASGTLAPLTPGTLAGKFLAFDADENPTAVVGVGGADTALRTELASAGGDARVRYTSPFSPAIITSTQTRLREGVSLKSDFGAVGDGSTLNSAAIQDAIQTCADEGFELEIPSGVYQFDSPINVVVPARAIGGTGRELTIKGKGSAHTALRFMGPNASDALTIEGNMPQTDRLHLQGFRVQRPDVFPNALTGAGLRLRNFSGFTSEDLLSFRHGKGVFLEGCLVGELRSSTLFYNYANFWAEQGEFESGPNLIALDNVALTAGFSRAAVVKDGCQFIFRACAIEGTGGENPDPLSAVGVELGGFGLAGAVGATFENCYFETNRGVDVYITHNRDLPATYAFPGTNFNRVPGVPSLCGIRLDLDSREAGDFPVQLDLRGAGFMAYGGSDATTNWYLATTAGGYDQLTIIEDGALFGIPGGIPPTNPLIRYDDKYGRPTGNARVGGDGTAVKDQGVVSVERLALGTYRITLREGAAGLQPHILPLGEPVVFAVVAEAASSVTIQAFNPTNGAVRDADFLFTAFKRRP